MREYRSLVALVLAILLLGAGCISFSGGTGDGGIFLSADRGEEWAQRGAVLTVGTERRSLANTDIRFLVQDPRDPKALYAGTDSSGAFFTWDGGTTWDELGSPFAKARVDAIALHPNDRCAFYVAAGSKVFRSGDCGRNWESSDFDVTIAALTIDPRNPTVLYAGNTKGDILKSTDGARGWRAIARLDEPIVAMLAQPFADSTAIFAATKRDGIFRSTDGGGTWLGLKDAMKEFTSAFDFRALMTAPANPGTLFHASRYGILRSSNLGTTWESVPLLTAPGSVDIFALAVDPNNSRSLVYATTATFYRTSDGGQHWESKKLPTSRQPTTLLIDRRDGDAVWLGTRKVKK